MCCGAPLPVLSIRYLPPRSLPLLRSLVLSRNCDTEMEKEPVATPALQHEPGAKNNDSSTELREADAGPPLSHRCCRAF